MTSVAPLGAVGHRFNFFKLTGEKNLGRTILEWIIQKWVSIPGIRLRVWAIGKPCESGIELSGSISHGVS